MIGTDLESILAIDADWYAFHQQFVAGKTANFISKDLPEPMRSFFLEHQTTSMLVVPIMVRGNCWGQIAFENCGEPQLYDEAEVITLKVAADSIAAAIERNRHQQERERMVRQRATELEEYNRMLRGRDRVLEATATAANTLLTTESLEKAVNAALQIIGESLDTDRVCVIEIEPFNEASNLSLVGWEILYEWHSLHAISQLRHPDYSRGNHEGIELWLEYLANGRVFSCLLGELPEPFRSSMAAIGLKAYHAVPIFVGGRYWGILGVDDCREAKRRDPAELAALKTAAACIGSAIQRDRTQKAILAAEQARTQELACLNAELQHALDLLSESEKRYRTLFELSNAGIFRFEVKPPISLALPADAQMELFHQHSYITAGNRAYAEMYGFEEPGNVAGMRLRDIYALDSTQNRDFIRTFVENGHQIQNYESEERDRHGNPRCFLNNIVTTIRDGRAIGGWGSQLDITDLRQAQETLAAERLQAETALIRERTRIAQEIHDTLAQTFTGITVQLELAQYLVERQETAPVGALLERIGSLAQTGLAEARRSVWAIHPASEAHSNLARDLSASVDNLAGGTGLQTRVTVEGEPRPLSHFASKHLLRIAQEAIANALRHAGATTLQVSLTYHPDRLCLSIRDDGCGFVPQASTEGFGLVGMSERADRIDGQLRIVTQLERGTEIFVEVPT